jgi:branched-chain amino acid transport system substrate-binding protein
MQKSRERWLNHSDEIVIGVTYPTDEVDGEVLFSDGINLAIEEINEKGVLGKKIIIKKVDDKGTVNSAAEVAQNFAADPAISAVIGHWYSRISDAVADIYNRNGMVMISPASTSTKLTAYGYDYIFTMINDDADYAGIIAKYAAEEKLDKVVVYYADEDYGRGLANEFEDAAYKYGIEIVDRTSCINNRNINELTDKWNALECNAFFVADAMGSAEEVIKILRQSGIQVPILGATGIDITSLLPSLGPYAEGTAIPTIFNPTIDRSETKNFVRNYEKKYGYLPDSWAAQGYDSVKLICHAIETAGSAMPDQIAARLKKTVDYQGVSGKLNCNVKGELVVSGMYVKLVQNGKYIYSDLVKLDK